MVKRGGVGSERLIWRAARDVAEVAAEATSGAQVGQEVMAVVARLVDCDVGSILSVTPGQEWCLEGQKEDNEILRRNHWRYATEMTPAELQHLVGGFSLDTEIFARNRRERMSVYGDFMRPNGQAGFIVRYWVMDGRLWGMGMSRSLAQFSERDRERLDALFPHLRAALRAGALLADARGAASQGAAWSLTPAEERVMSLVTRGLTNAEAAGLLGISPNTLRNTLARVFNKVGVSSRSELAFIVGGGVPDEAAFDAAAADGRTGVVRRQVAALETIRRGEPQPPPPR
jgi:DNA-binding CsgD family transcriptional regulator